MPTQIEVLQDLAQNSCRPVFYSCQYEEHLHRRQHLSEQQTALPIQWSPVMRPSGYFEEDSGLLSKSCRHDSSKTDQDVAVKHGQILPEACYHENRNRKLRQRRYRMTSYIGERILQCKQRYQLMTSEQCRRRRFPSMAQRKAANVREQRRMSNLKEAFKSLRECLPTFSFEKKMSRIETLRLAIAYINLLRKLLDDSEQDSLAGISTHQPETGREC